MSARQAFAPRRARTVAWLVVGALVLGPTAAASAYWSASASPATAPLAAATVPVPGSFTCSTVRPGGVLSNNVARLTWTAVTGATSYEIWVRNAAGTTRTLLTTTPNTTIDLNSNLLNGLLSTLLTLLLGGQPLYAEVVAVHSTGWRSTPTAATPFRNDGLLGGLLGGIRCGT